MKRTREQGRRLNQQLASNHKECTWIWDEICECGMPTSEEHETICCWCQAEKELA